MLCDKYNNFGFVSDSEDSVSLCIRPVCLLCAQWVAKDTGFILADNEDYDQLH